MEYRQPFTAMLTIWALLLVIEAFAQGVPAPASGGFAIFAGCCPAQKQDPLRVPGEEPAGGRPGQNRRGHD